ncbi:unnamed protein product, partial [Urochloa humidicola]
GSSTTWPASDGSGGAGASGRWASRRQRQSGSPTTAGLVCERRRRGLARGQLDAAGGAGTKTLLVPGHLRSGGGASAWSRVDGSSLRAATGEAMCIAQRRSSRSRRGAGRRPRQRDSASRRQRCASACGVAVIGKEAPLQAAASTVARQASSPSWGAEEQLLPGDGPTKMVEKLLVRASTPGRAWDTMSTFFLISPHLFSCHLNFLIT